jgi:hypothetical protein
MAILVTGNTFADGDQVTSTKLNNIANAATFASGAVDGATTTLTAGGAIQVGIIQPGNIASNAVTTAKIADATDTSTGVTNTKLRWSAATSVIGRSAASSGAPADIAASANDQVLRMSGGAIGFGTITPSSLTQWMTSETAQTASGTSVNFTGIPSWVKRITLLFNGVSVDTAGNTFPYIQIGDSGGLENSGYTGRLFNETLGFHTAFSNGFQIQSEDPSYTMIGTAYLHLIGANTWIYSYSGLSTAPRIMTAHGSKQLSATLDRLSIFPQSGNFDGSGTINIIYE